MNSRSFADCEEKVNRPRQEKEKGRRGGEGRETLQETASSFEHPKKGNARTPVDLR